MAALPFTPLAIGAACIYGICKRKATPRQPSERESPCDEPRVSDKIRSTIANAVAGGDRVCRASSSSGPCVQTGVTARRVFAGGSRVCRFR